MNLDDFSSKFISCFSSMARCRREEKAPRLVHLKPQAERRQQREPSRGSWETVCGGGSSNRSCRSGRPPARLPVSLTPRVAKESQWGGGERTKGGDKGKKKKEKPLRAAMASATLGWHQSCRWSLAEASWITMIALTKSDAATLIY